MPRSADELIAYFGADRVATVRRSKQGVRLDYDHDVIEMSAGRPLVSCSLPVGRRSQDATAFFDGVLPEGAFRDALASKADLRSSDTFGMLERYGRDIAGALSLVVDGSERMTEPGLVDLDDEALVSEILAVPDLPLGVHDDSELSIPGFQDKLLLVKTSKGWARPAGGMPSTHIVKLDNQRHAGVVRAEHEAMRLALTVGLTTVDTEVKTIGGIDCLFVERFDRYRANDGSVERTHQEDACQALGRSPENKYELRTRGSRLGGGPEFVEVAGVLDRFAADPETQHVALVRIATFTALIGNCDAHGKNVAFVHHGDGFVRLAPLYDTVPTVLFPALKNEAAMTIGGALDLASVRCSTIVREARSWRMDQGLAELVALELVEQVSEAVAGRDTPLASIVRERCDRFDDRAGS